MSRSPPFEVAVSRDPAVLRAFEAQRGADAFGAGMPFADILWLEHWYACFTGVGGIQPRIAVLYRPGEGRGTSGLAAALDEGRAAALVPLIRRTRLGLPLIEFADRGVTDYNVAIPGPAAPTSFAERVLAFRALARSLRPYARLKLAKMPYFLDGRVSPVCAPRCARPSPLAGYELALLASPEAFTQNLPGRKRKDLRRERRHLEALGTLASGPAANDCQRRALYDLILASQRARIPAKGERYVLEEAGYKTFYDRLVFDPRLAPLSLVFGLWLNETPIAAILCVRKGERVVTLRIGQSEDAQIARLGPGRNAVHALAQWAASRGHRTLDLSLGRTELKRWFGAQPIALADQTVPLGWLGGETSCREVPPPAAMALMGEAG